MMTAKKCSLLVLCMGVLSGCAAVGPTYQRPEMELPQAWPAGESPTAVPGESATSIINVGERWWTLYGDSRLDALQEEALTHNADVQVAAARVLEARAQAGITNTDRAPVIYAAAGARRTQSSQVGSNPLPAGTPRTQNDFRATLEASYELDLWGRYQRASEAARAELMAAESSRETVRLTLTADVARNYFGLLAADQREAVLRRTVDARNETLGLIRLRLSGGVASQFDLDLAQAEEAEARILLAGVALAREQQEATLAVLLGRSPRAVMSGAISRELVAMPTPTLAVPAGLPSELLLRRPDIRVAEQKLIAENARIGAVRAQVFPAITLTAFLGSESATLSDLFSGPAGIYQFASNLIQPLFNAGRLKHAQAAAQARRDQALASYQLAVANAFADVRRALAAQESARAILGFNGQRTNALHQAYQQATRRHEGGLISRVDLLDIERQRLQAELTHVDAAFAQRVAAIDLIKALGGGWSVSSEARAQADSP